jgi:glutamyl-tRNA reductase
VRLLALGVDHRSAPAAVREAIAFDGTKYARALSLFARTFPDNEFVILSTCNRVELYVAGNPENIPEIDALTDTLVQLHGVQSEVFAGHLVSYHDEGAVGHLFRVAASLESLVLGEGQILGQVRDAYRTAVDCKTVGPAFHTVFQAALRVGKLVRERTGMDQGKLSVASVAVDVAKGVFDSFADKIVLVIGAGKMGELTLQHLKGLNPGQILVTNRNSDRALATAARWNGRAVPYERLEQALIDADLVISTTAAAEPVVTLEQYARVQRARGNRLALILDIAFPRDFDPRIGELEQVMLYHVDELRAQAEENRLSRQKGIDPALAIIEREAIAC